MPPFTSSIGVTTPAATLGAGLVLGVVPVEVVEVDLTGSATGTVAPSTPGLSFRYQLFGTAAGGSSVHEGAPPFIKVDLGASAIGTVVTSTPGLSFQYRLVPLHIRGVGGGVVSFDLVHVEPPIGDLPPVPTFCWGHTLSFDDLVLMVIDSSGNYVAPFEVFYVMFWVLPDGTAVKAGPDRRPVMRQVGIYYVTGIAGENGQPGGWFVRWSYRRTFGGLVTDVIQPFLVLDAAKRDPFCRSPKYGWD